MAQRIATVALIVTDYDEAIAFYRDGLGFTLTSNTPLGDGKRWVTVAPPGSTTRLLLAKAADDAQSAAVGMQGAGRVFLFLETDDFDRDHAAFRARGVNFLEEPRREAYGTVAVFEDLYGNRWDLIQPRPDAASAEGKSR
ncbi:VOC family protein [Lichenifustis flavocetrariae]